MILEHTPSNEPLQDKPDFYQTTCAKLDPAHLADLMKSGLSEQMIYAMRIQSHQTAALLGFLGWDMPSPGLTGYAIPYFDRAGEKTEGQNFRLYGSATHDKASGTDINGKKLPKYAKPLKSANQLYFPPGVSTLLEKNDYCIVTEGEKKAAKAVQDGFPCVAIAGVWNWADSGHRRIDKAAGRSCDYGTQPMQPLLELARKKKLVILFDSDAAEKKQVSNALAVMSDALLFHGASWVRKIDMPVPDDVDSDTTKIGLDDLLIRSDGKLLLDQALADVLQKRSWEIRPFLRFKYAKSTSDRPLHYIVKNTHTDALPAEKCILAEVEEKDANGTSIITTKVLSKTRVWMRRTITDIDTNETRYEVAYVPVYGDRVQYLRGGAELLLTGSNTKDDPYAAHGAAIHPKYRSAVADFLHDCQSSGKSAKVTGTTQRGWINRSGVADGSPIYLTENIVMTATTTIAADDMACPIVPIAEAAHNGYSHAECGDVKMAAITLLSEVLVHPIPAMMCGAAVGSLLRHWCPDSENFIVHLYGDSSGGKTTCLKIAASLFGAPRPLIDSWRSTSNGLEGRLVARNHLPIFLDEAHLQDNPKMLTDAAYLIGNEKQKLRAGRDGSSRPTKSFQVVALSTGEKTLLDVVGEVSTAGREVRVVQIPTGLGDQGCWGNKSGKDIDRLTDIFTDHHGGLMPLLIQEILTLEQATPGCFSNYMKKTLECLKERLPKGAPNNVARRMKHYALIITGLSLLCNVALKVQEEKSPKNAAANLVAPTLRFMIDHMLQLPSDEHDVDQDVKRLHHLASQLAVHQSKFPQNGDRNGPIEIWGKTGKDGVSILDSELKKLIGPSMSKDMMVASMTRHKIVEPTSGKNIIRNVRLGDYQARGYVINLKTLAAFTSK